MDPGKNLFKCFTCGESGDVFSFPMKHLGMGFTDAVRWVAESRGPSFRAIRRSKNRLQRTSTWLENLEGGIDYVRRVVCEQPMVLFRTRAGAPVLLSRRRMTAELPIEKVGARLREMMPWIRKNRLVDTSKN